MSDADALSSSASADDWPAKAATTVVGYVDTVRNATTGKALVISRAVVYFLALGLLGIVTFFLLLILLVRGLVSLTSLLPFIDPGEVWLSYLVLGTVFTLVGALLWKKKGA